MKCRSKHKHDNAREQSKAVIADGKASSRPTSTVRSDGPKKYL